MKKRVGRKRALLLSMILAGGMLLEGCGSQTVDNRQAISATESGEISDNFNASGLPVLNEKETFTIAVPEKSPIKKAAEKICVIEAEEATNIHIEWMEIPSSGWTEKINVMFSTGSLPDAIIGDVDIARNYEQLAPLDDYLVQYAPAVTEFFDSRDDYPQALYAPDGTIRTLPAGDESVHNTIDSQFWINQDWLDKLGLSMPQTPEELKHVLIAFRDQDPNGNGETDEIPFTFESAWGWGNAVENIFGAFGVLENDDHVFTIDNKVTFSAEEQGYYNALLYLNDLYKEGLIDKDVFTLSNDQYAARDPEGDTVGLLAGYASNSCGCQNTEIYSALPLLKGPEGKQMVVLNNITKTGGFTISRNCKNPAALVRWYDYINSSLELALEWGRGAEGVYWEIIEQDGKEIPMFLTMGPEELEQNGGYKSYPEYRNAESFGGSTPSLWREEYMRALVHDDKWPPEPKLDAVLEQTEYGVISLPAGTASLENAERRAILKTDIDTYLKKFISDSVINGIDEEKWEEHLKALESLKTDEYTSLCQEFVDSKVKE